ncbi:uncharacterized protein LOC125058926 isoform X1 [Pieris napi]|uniref:uncharacterized protein LOC125058926 isoform X1 n=1 Tax=Pieris napi TaxID=78633 RepID=UPI001FBA5F43|nr:uncharacterized protein LOC125058926 isoform X1 [Pieris napi]
MPNQSDSENDTPSKKSKKYLQKYKPEWEREPDFLGWIGRCQNPYEAKCKVCNKIINIASGKESLRRHATAEKHKRNLSKGYNELHTLEATSDSDDSTTLDPESELWGFYDKESRNRAKCSMCGVIINRHPDTLYQHLKEEHSKVSKTLEFNDRDENYTEIIYLENPPNEKERPVKRKRREKKEQYDDLEDFGKYVVGLLKGIPEEQCTELQMSIVNLIMTAKKSVKDDDVLEREESIEQVQEPTKPESEDPITHEQKETKDTREKPRKRYNDLGSTDNDDHISNFGKYLTSLMKLLNKETSAEVQLNIVNLIIGTKLQCLRKTKNKFMEIQTKLLLAES